MNEFLGLRDQIKESIYDLTMQLDGSFSAEHGIGLAKKEELKDYSSNAEIDLMKLIKRNLDPKNIMNPRKVFD